MKKGLTEIALILDASGSMRKIKSDTIGGVNAFIEEQKKIPGDGRLTLCLFNTEVVTLFESVPLGEVKELTEDDYKPNNNTSLHEAVIVTIEKIGERLENTPEAERPEKVIIGILTDGEENSSGEGYTLERVRENIEHQRTKYNWEFVFLGANQDAWAAGTQLGVAGASCFNFNADSKGVRSAACLYSQTVTSYRTS